MEDRKVPSLKDLVEFSCCKKLSVNVNNLSDLREGQTTHGLY